MLELTVILAAAAVVYAICRATRLPSIPLLVAVGIGIAAIGVMPDQDFVLEILEVGLAFLVFVAGIEMSPARIGEQRLVAFRVGVAQFLLLGALAGGITALFGFNFQAVLYVALAISASSTLVVVRLLKQRRELFESFGRMVLGVLLLQDAMVISGLVILAVMSGEPVPLLALGADIEPLGQVIIEAPDFWADMVLTSTGILLVLGSWQLGRSWLPKVIDAYHDQQETMLLVVLATLFGFAGLAWLGGVPIVVGAFCGGLALSSFPTRALVNSLVNSLNDFFLVIFFIALGALFTIPSAEYLVLGLILTGVVLVITPLLVAFVAERAGMTARGALEAGLVISQTSEFSLVVALYGWGGGLIDEEMFSMLVGITVVTMTVTPILSHPRTAGWLMRFHPSAGPKTKAPDRTDHVVIVGGGTAGSLLVERLQQVHQPVVVIDNDPMVTQRFRQRDCESVWGDAENEQTLREAGVDRAQAIIVTTGSLHHLQEVMNLAPKDAQIWLHAFESAQAEVAKQMGAQTLVYSEASAEVFMDWFHNESGMASQDD